MSVVKPLYIYPIPYVFQEIRNVRTNSIFGYEAFLRPEGGMDARAFVNARMMMGATHQLELDTFFNAVKTFSELKMPGYLKINSLPSECLDVHEGRLLASEYGKEILSRVVVDILEYPFLNRDAWYEKERFMLRYDMKCSLNAFGEGIFRDFSSVNFFHPDIVTIPASLIHNFTENPQQMEYIKWMIQTLKEQDTVVLAQGVENMLEYHTLVEYGIDLAQGYYIGMPQVLDAPDFIPDEIPEETDSFEDGAEDESSIV